MSCGPGRTRVARIGVVALAIAGSLALGATAQACTRTWAAGTGDWTTPADWNPVGVPTAADDVCLPSGATYTVTVPAISGGATVGSLTVGGNGGGTVTLELAGGSGQAGALTQVAAAVTSTQGGTIAANGIVVLDSTEAGGAALTGGTFANYGTIVAQTEALNPVDNYLRVSVANELTGALRIASGSLVTDNGSTFQNLGSVLVPGPGTWLISTDPAQSATPTRMINGGVVSGGSSLATLDASWTQVGGVVNGGPVSIQSGLLDYEAGTGSFEITPDRATAPSQLAGRIPVLQTVTASGGTLQLIGPGVRNDGTLVLSSYQFSAAPTRQDIVLVGAPLANFGELTLSGSLRTDLLNSGRVTIGAGQRLVQDSGGAFDNAGTLVLAPGARYSLSTSPPASRPSTFENDGPGTVELDLASTSSGQIQLGSGGAMTAGGTLLALPQGFSPYQGQIYPVVTSSGGSLTGAFTAIRDGFRLLTPAPNVISLAFGQAVRHALGGRRAFSLTDICASGYSPCRQLLVRASAKERIVRYLGRGSTRRRVVRTATRIVAMTSTYLEADETRTLKVELNDLGRALLARARHALPVSVTASSGGRTLLRATVRVRP